ncbi:iron-sulfur cluster biosynthesis family protein [Brevibacillus ginsengisoli]|uniref:iron-sulfur cluster biosynthesis family protein n=1 Tax=Brevibacillus ginsengisoli TaxID=363854 RepID=UPI003CEE2C06
MNVTIKEAAYEALRKHSFKQGTALRIKAELSGDCGCAYYVHLIKDNPQDADSQLVVEGIPVIIDSLTQTLLGQDMTLNYNPKFGFALSSPQEIFSYSLGVVEAK